MGGLRSARAAARAVAARRSRRTLRPRRARSILSLADARERVAIPVWNGVLSALGALVIGLIVALLAMIAFVFAGVLAFGTIPSTAPGHVLLTLSEIVFYVASGWFAWARLQVLRGAPLRRLAASDLRVLGIAIVALLVVKSATILQLVLTNQASHVQAGFEHYSVVTKVPLFTAVTIALAALVLVVIGPVSEELVFRGLLFGALAKPLGTLGAALVTALLFGAAHGDLILFPSLAALGFICALAYGATGNLTVPVLLHVLNNALGAVFLIIASLGR